MDLTDSFPYYRRGYVVYWLMDAAGISNNAAIEAVEDYVKTVPDAPEWLDNDKINGAQEPCCTLAEWKKLVHP